MKWIKRQQINPSNELLDYGAIFAQILFARGIKSKVEAEQYLHSNLTQLPLSSLMPNIGDAVKNIESSLLNEAPVIKMAFRTTILQHQLLYIDELSLLSIRQAKRIEWMIYHPMLS